MDVWKYNLPGGTTERDTPEGFMTEMISPLMPDCPIEGMGFRGVAPFMATRIGSIIVVFYKRSVARCATNPVLLRFLQAAVVADLGFEEVVEQPRALFKDPFELLELVAAQLEFFLAGHGG